MILVLDVTEYIKWRRIHVSDNFFVFLNEYVNSMGLNNFRFDNNNTEKVCKYMIVLNKSDLMSQSNEKHLIYEVLENNLNTVLISCYTGYGLQQLLEKLTGNFKDLYVFVMHREVLFLKRLFYRCGVPSKEHPSMNRERHRHLLEVCVQHLEQCLHKLEDDTTDVVIMAQYLRLALRQIGKLTGNVTTEELLNVIFKDFCIGK